MSFSIEHNHRTLVISSWAPPMAGGVQYFYNIFSQFSRSTYGMLTNASVIQRGLVYGGKWLDAPYYFSDDPTATKESITAVQNKGLQSPVPISKFTQRLRQNIFLRFGYFLLVTCRDSLRFVNLGRQILKRENYTLLLGISDTGPAIIATYILSRLTGKPYAYYLFDLYRGYAHETPDRWLANLFEGMFFRHAKYIVVNNEGTKKFLEERYGQNVTIHVIPNALFPESYSLATPYKPVAPYKILFTGHVYWAQEQALQNLIKACSLLEDLPIILDLYIPRPNQVIITAIQGHANIHLSAAPPSEMPNIQRQASLLFLPLSWHTKGRDIIATATPGKYTDYLASGRPMLIHAPEYAFISRYVKQHQLGLVVDQNNVEDLVKEIRNFFRDPSQGGQYISNSLKEFHQNHDARINAKKLTALLNTV